ncbi:nicotinamide-nucleotide amidohydrolase family protein [Brachybacterium sp. JHP9]|uniref:Nicotinamide-nucleotide amidohydrolase family protein n=1 Tax=Brachybacterium equifaecis TaxID=2910770 RepID=A0ABT0QWL9_9MICO|nr:nicotinamide-nucleotide amidohydrolase family protein [Brachybacterium equifaecis]
MGERQGPDRLEEESAAIAQEVVQRAAARGLRLAAAESLTGGLLAARLIDVPGASACVAGGAVCYALDAKTDVLGVDAQLLRREGAVTAEVARQMARGAARLYRADLALATTGVAGPGPDDRGVPAGTVWIALASRSGPALVRELRLSGDRAQVRGEAVRAALALLRDRLRDSAASPQASEPSLPAGEREES